MVFRFNDFVTRGNYFWSTMMIRHFGTDFIKWFNLFTQSLFFNVFRRALYFPSSFCKYNFSSPPLPHKMKITLVSSSDVFNFCCHASTIEVWKQIIEYINQFFCCLKNAPCNLCKIYFHGVNWLTFITIIIISIIFIIYI